MKIHEHQAKSLLAQYGIPVPLGKVSRTAAKTKRIVAELGGRAVIKAQVYAGGRGKAGGIKLVNSPEEAEQAARQILGKKLVTHQTGPEGVPVSKVLVEETVAVEQELYLGMVIDNSRRCPVVMASEAGGMDIEEVARASPEKIHKAHVDPAVGFQPFQGRQLAYAMGLSQGLVKPAVELMSNLCRLFRERDCSLAEINPLVVTQGKLVALDAKLNFDDNAAFRHTDIAELRDIEQEDSLEVRAKQLGIQNYVKLDGNIGCMVNGAGLAMAVMDLITEVGGRPANFLDIGTMNNTERVVNAFRLFLTDPDVKAILVNIFGGMARADIIAQGIVEAHQQMQIGLPIVVRLAGTNVEEGKRILAQSGIKFTPAEDFYSVARLAVEAAKGGKN